MGRWPLFSHRSQRWPQTVDGGAGGQPLPIPGPTSSPSPAVLAPQETRRQLGEWCVQVFKHSCQGSTLTPPAVDTRARGIGSGQGWLTAASNISNSFKEATIHFPTQRPFSQLRGCSPSHLSPWLVSQMPHPTVRETFVKVSQTVFPSKPSQMPCSKQGEVHVLPRSNVSLRDLVQSPLEGCSHHQPFPGSLDVERVLTVN